MIDKILGTLEVAKENVEGDFRENDFMDYFINQFSLK